MSPAKAALLEELRVERQHIARPAATHRAAPQPLPEWTQEQQDLHVRDLLAALDGDGVVVKLQERRSA